MTKAGLLQMVEGGGTMALRHNDPRYLARVDLWWDELLPRLTRFLHVNGGRVLMVQVRGAAQAAGILHDCASFVGVCVVHAGCWQRLGKRPEPAGAADRERVRLLRAA